MIKLTKLSKKFGQNTAIDNLNFSAKNGEIIGFLGANGAGKTTTMRLILGLLKPTNGDVAIFGLEPIKNRIDLMSRVGYLPENNPLFMEMKVQEYLDFILNAKNIESEDEISKVSEEVGISDRMNSKIEELSRGYKQRVGLAAALLGRPDILILDEPTSGLDPIEQDKIKKLIKKFSQKKIVIFSTHILSEVEDVANRLIIIDKGKLVYDGKKPARKGSVEKLFKKLITKRLFND